MSLRNQLRRYAVHLTAIVGLAVIAAAVGGYVLVHQRLKLPWKHTYSVRVALQTAQALTPGQGQEVTVAGVKVGEIGSVDLKNGVAVVRLDINRDELPAVHADAKALVRPKTGLQDMTIDLDPGTSRAPALTGDEVLPVSRTLPSVNVDEILAGLDADTRAYMKGLLQGVGEGLGHGGAVNLRKLLKIARPSLARTSELTAAIRARRVELRRLVSNLALLSGRMGRQGGDLARLVSQGNATFGAIASEDASVRGSLARLPGTLDAADGALAAARPLARSLAPALRELEPAATALRPALRDLKGLATAGRPAVGQLRGLSREAPPVARQLSGALAQIQPLTPDLSRAFDVLSYVTNELAYNPKGPEEGFLFWLAWGFHNANSMLSTQDANGGLWRGQLIFSCSNVQQASLLVPALAPAAKAGICPN